MKYDLRPEALEDLHDPGSVADIDQRGFVRIKQRPPMQGQLDGVQRGLVVIQHDQLGGAELMQLPAELGSNGSSSAGYQDSPARESASQ